MKRRNLGPLTIPIRMPFAAHIRLLRRLQIIDTYSHLHNCHATMSSGTSQLLTAMSLLYQQVEANGTRFVPPSRATIGFEHLNRWRFTEQHMLVDASASSLAPQLSHRILTTPQVLLTVAVKERSTRTSDTADCSLQKA